MKGKIANASLASKIRYSYLIFFVPLVLLMFFGVYSVYYSNRRYNDMIQSATVASKFGLEFKDDFDYETYLLIVGNKTPQETTLYRKLDHAREIINNLEALSVTEESRDRLESLQRYLTNLNNYVDRIIDNLKEDDRYEENLQIWENDVQIVTSLLNESMNEYLYYEIQNIQTAQAENEKSYIKMLSWMIVAMAVIGAALLILSFVISDSIASPIRELNKVTNQVAKGDLSVRAHVADGTEVRELGTSLNQMIDKIENLLGEVLVEQTHLREAELELLQAQINPHFLYNTLDTIVWLAETGNQKQVVQMTESLSEFFRVSLSKGKDMVMLEEEMRHVRSYLEIQQIRYRDILTYEIELDEELKSCQIPKISLQPLVENALYHGIKNKRGLGKITICTKKLEDHFLIQVMDNGIGMNEEQLEKVRESVLKPDEKERTGYGLFNVNERIRLKYGEEYGLSFDSVYREGTTVTVKLPRNV